MNSPTVETTKIAEPELAAPPELLKNSIEIIPGLVRVGSQDVERLTNLLKNSWRINELWDDESRANPGLWFMSHYVNPTNMIFDVGDGAGMIAFIRTIPGWRSQVYFAGWARAGFRAYDQWRAAAQVMMLANDLRVIDGFILPHNTKSRRTAEKMGMHYRGPIKTAQWYNGVLRTQSWYEISDVDLGLRREDE